MTPWPFFHATNAMTKTPKVATYLCLDLEFQKTEEEAQSDHVNAVDRGLAVAVAVDSRTGTATRYMSCDVAALWDAMQEVDLVVGWRLCQAGLRVFRENGFNTRALAPDRPGLDVG